MMSAALTGARNYVVDVHKHVTCWSAPTTPVNPYLDDERMLGVVVQYYNGKALGK